MPSIRFTKPIKYFQTRCTNEVPSNLEPYTASTVQNDNCRACIAPWEGVPACSIAAIKNPSGNYDDVPREIRIKKTFDLDDTIYSLSGSAPAVFQTAGDVLTQSVLGDWFPAEGVPAIRSSDSLLWRWQPDVPGYNGPLTFSRELKHVVVEVADYHQVSYDLSGMTPVWEFSGTQVVKCVSIAMGWSDSSCAFVGGATFEVEDVVYAGAATSLPRYTITTEARDYLITKGYTVPVDQPMTPMIDGGFGGTILWEAGYAYGMSRFGSLDAGFSGPDGTTGGFGGAAVDTRYNYSVLNEWSANASTTNSTTGPGLIQASPFNIKSYARQSSSSWDGYASTTDLVGTSWIYRNDSATSQVPPVFSSIKYHAFNPAPSTAFLTVNYNAGNVLAAFRPLRHDNGVGNLSINRDIGYTSATGRVYSAGHTVFGMGLEGI